MNWKMNNMLKIENIIPAIMILFLLWLGISWIDVIADNLQPAPVHSDMNFFVIITKLFGGKQ